MASPAWPPPTMIVSVNSDTSKSLSLRQVSTVAVLVQSNTPFRPDLGGSVRQSKRLLRH